MTFSVLNRKVHYWLAILVAVPAIIIIVTGLILSLRKHVAWVQPPEQAGAGREPTLTMPQVLEIMRAVPEAEVKTWKDVSRVEYRPTKGMCKVWCKNSWEVQLDTSTGDVLQVAYRRSDMIKTIHEGTWFHEGVQLAIFLPAGIILLTLWLTGMYLFWLPIYVKSTRKSAAAADGKATEAKPPASSPPA
ncbi:MAG: PepSY domain-containing protein [Planctomycetes bacterium]|nr:PepSY domain-containing protein [Planctomycetota bacterium]